MRFPPELLKPGRVRIDEQSRIGDHVLVPSSSSPFFRIDLIGLSAFVLAAAEERRVPQDSISTRLLHS